MRSARTQDAVLARVAQDVAQRVPHLARRTEDVLVVTIGEDAASPLPESIQRSGHANGEPLHAARQRCPACAFSEQVQMIGLHAEVHQPEARTTTSRGDRAAQNHEFLPSAQ